MTENESPITSAKYGTRSVADATSPANQSFAEAEEFDAIKAIEELKASTVSKEEYNKVKQENARLMKTLVSGGQIENPQPKKDIATLRKELFTTDNHMSNLEYISRALELRDAVIDEGGVDPFLPSGNMIAPTQTDIEAANRLASVLKDCVEYANGDSQLFTAELQRVTRAVKIR